MKRILAIVLILMTLFSLYTHAEVPYDDNQTVIAMIGDESSFVYVVELALAEKGYLMEDEVDGYFDQYTELAVMNFQEYKGYIPDGRLTKIQFYWLHRTYYNEWFDKSDIVYITENGTRYHVWGCMSIANSYALLPISVNIASELGYLPCRRCLYW